LAEATTESPAPKEDDDGASLSLEYCDDDNEGRDGFDGAPSILSFSVISSIVSKKSLGSSS